MYKKLYRSRKDKMIAGVASGLAEYFEIDPTLVRIIFVISLFLGGTGVLAYIILWIVVPEEPLPGSETNKSGTEGESQTGDFSGKAHDEAWEAHRQKRATTGGIILLVLGFLFLANNFLPRFDLGNYWPLILIAIGVGLLLNAKK